MPRLVRRSGFTLVELLVALVVFDVALLALAADGAMLVRLRGVSARRDAAVSAAQSRLAGLRALGCPPPSGGVAAVAPGVRETWGVLAVGSAERRLTDSVSYDGLSGRAVFVLRTTVVC